LSHTFELYKLNQADPFDCSSSLLWNNGRNASAIIGTRGDPAQDFCYFDITEIFPRDDLLDPSEVYFLLNGVTTVGNTLFLDRKTDYVVTPAADTIYYLTEWDTTVLATDGANTIITITAQNITYPEASDFEYPATCSLDAAMATIDYFTFDPPNWFTSPQIPTVDIEFYVVGTLHLCDGSSRRMLMGENARFLQTEVTNVEFVELTLTENAVRTLLYTDPTTGPTAPPTTAPPTTAAPTSEPKSHDLAIILGATGGGLVFSIIVIWFFVYRRRKSTGGDTYDRV
jgi:hypothetical protein